MLVRRAQSWPENLILPKRQLHRGGQMGFHENTLPAFREARRLNAEMLELDVILSGDGTPYVCHDYNLQRVFNVDCEIRQTCDGNIEKLGLIPSLKEVLLAEDIPSFLNIEIKSDQILDRNTVVKVAEVVREHGQNKKVLFSSFNPMVLFHLSLELPLIPRGLLITDPSEVHFMLRSFLWTYVAKAHLVHIRYDLLDAQVIHFWKDHGYQVAAWTVNDLDVEKKLFAMGLDSVISDY